MGMSVTVTVLALIVVALLSSILIVNDNKTKETLTIATLGVAVCSVIVAIIEKTAV